MTTRTQKPAEAADQKPAAGDPTDDAAQAATEEQLAELQAAIDDAVAKALADQKPAADASNAPAQAVSVVEEPLGRQFLGKSDFVPIWDKEGKELPAVPKHWAADQLPLGSTKKKPADS